MKIFDIAIIGAGPSGIMAAITAAKLGKQVILLEKNEIIGRKILATGNGRCNLTNKNIDVSRYHGANPKFIQQILSNFDQFQVMEYFESLGVVLKEEDNGRIFPRTNQASSVVEALDYELKKMQVNIETSALVKNIQYEKNWIISGEHQEKKFQIEAKNLILTTGGKATFQLGSSGDGLFWSSKLGHTIIPPAPALVPIETVETWPKNIQGLKIEGVAKIVADEKQISESQGDILFTHFGLSGPAIMKQSRIISLLIPTQKVEIHIDVIPEATEKILDKKIETILNANGAKSVKNALAGFVPGDLMNTVLLNLEIDPDKKSSRISKLERTSIVKGLKDVTLTVRETRSFKEAQVTAGGISAEEINAKTLESKKIPHLFFAGEIIDVDGDSGGFNLQWAWASGYLAGTSASK
ncbi:MAG: NAD(P)/FAD-dependent oxidoreductase [Candidatus Magasanikbacteria bacterium]|nr:NAD(P)/FAD-dependent oxidoreductase [Candidatus Magasanikbacteria bacterium]